jgi:hypothetical protein
MKDSSLKERGDRRDWGLGIRADWNRLQKEAGYVRKESHHEIQEKRTCLAFLKGCDRMKSTCMYFRLRLAYHNSLNPHKVYK